MNEADGIVGQYENGYTYGVVCSQFSCLAHGHPIPQTTFGMRYSPNMPGFKTEKMDLYKDMRKIRAYDLITQGYGHTGHTVVVSDIINVDNTITAIRVLESNTPATKDTLFWLHNGLPYRKAEPETWYHNAYDYMHVSDPAFDRELAPLANWESPYTEPQKVMCSRGYGAIYLQGKHNIVLSVAPDVEKITISVDGVDVGSFVVKDMTDLQKNGYYLLDITDKVSPGTVTIRNDQDDGTEVLHYINVDDYNVSYSISGDNVTITTNHPEKVKFLGVAYNCKETATTGVIVYAPDFVG